MDVSMDAHYPLHMDELSVGHTSCLCVSLYCWIEKINHWQLYAIEW